MEENVALDSSKQKQFVKSLKGLKKLMKKSGAIPDKPEKKEIKPIQDGKVTKKRFKARGLVYLSHIPHGFYEHQMTEYFKQFGVVTNARVIRSKHTGRSKGHAFVEFKDTAVAQIVAETMNNYLMGKRLIKAVYIPPKDQRRNARRKNWNAQNNLGNKIRLNMKKAYNADKSENEELKIASKLLTNLSNTKKKLKELGIDCDFFTPVDIPEGLSDKGLVKEEKKEDKSNIDEKPNKKIKKEAVKRSTEMNETTDENIDETENKQDEQKAKKKPKNQTKLNKTNDTPNDKKLSSISKSNSNTDSSKQNKKKIDGKKNKIVNEAEPEGNKHAQEQKQQKLKAAGVKPPEDFIKLGTDEDDSDSSYQFDSDEYENMINDEDESTDNDGTDDDGDELDISESKDLAPKSKNKGKQVIVQSVKPSEPKDKPKQESKQKPQQAKRKKPEKVAVQSKKPKFEKQSSKKLPNKQIKKK